MRRLTGFAVGGMAAATLISRSLGFAKSVALVWLIGGTAASVGGQAFNVANELPVNVANLIVGSAIGSFLVPQIVAAVRGGQRDRAVVDGVLTVALMSAAVLTAVLTIAAPWLVTLYAARFSQSWIELATLMAYWCIPQVFFLAVYTLAGQVLNAQGSFAPFAWAPALSNAISLLGLAVFAGMFGALRGGVDQWNPWTIAVLCGVTTLATAAQAVLVWLRLRSTVYRPRFRVSLSGLRGPGKAAALTLIGVIAGQAAYVVVSNVANAAGQTLHNLGIDGASLNSLSYAYLVVLVPHGVAAVSIATKLLTDLSHGLHESGDTNALHALVSAQRRVLFVSALAAVFLVLAGTSIGELLWRSAPIGVTITLLAPGMIGFSEMYLNNRASLALSDPGAVMWSGICVAIVTATTAAGAALVPPEYVVYAIAAGISIANLGGWLTSSLLLRRTIRRAHLTGVQRDTWRFWVQQLAATLGAALVGWVIVTLLPAETDVLPLFGTIATTGAATAVAYFAFYNGTRAAIDRHRQSLTD